MIKFRLSCLVVCACVLNACLSAPTAVRSTPTPGPAPAPTTPAAPTATPVEPYRDPGLSPEQRAEALLALMTLDEKIGQMTQVEKNSRPRSNDQLPFASASVPAEGCEAPLFPFGYGLKTTDSSPVLLECATP